MKTKDRMEIGSIRRSRYVSESVRGVGEKMVLKRVSEGAKNPKQIFQYSSWKGVAMIILPLALILRIPKLQSRPIWYDEAFSIFLSQQSLEKIIQGTAADTMPPLYYFLLKGWMLLCHQVWFLRTLNIVFSLAIVALIYQAASKWFDRRAGFMAALFTAVSPLQIYHAQEIRMYALLTLALLGYLYFFMRLWDERRADRLSWVNWLGFVLCGATAVYSHNLAIFSVVVPIFLLVYRREWRFLSRLVVAQVGIVLLWLPWMLIVPMQIAKIQTAFWTPQPGILQILQAVITFHTNLPVPDWFLPIALFTSLLTTALVSYEVAKIARGNRSIHTMLSFMLLPPLLLFVVSYVMRPLFVPRAIMLSSLVYYALVGRIVSEARSRPIGLFLCLLIVLPALVVLPSQYSFKSFPRSPFQDAADDLAFMSKDGDAIVHDNKLSYFPMHFYQPSLSQEFIADEPGSHNDTLALGTQQAMGIFPVRDLQTAIGNTSRVWFVVFERAIEEYTTNGYPNHPQLAWLMERFNVASLHTYNDLLIYEFAR